MRAQLRAFTFHVYKSVLLRLYTQPRPNRVIIARCDIIGINDARAISFAAIRCDDKQFFFTSYGFLSNE